MFYVNLDKSFFLNPKRDGATDISRTFQVEVPSTGDTSQFIIQATVVGLKCVDYIDMNRRFEKGLQPLYGRADSIMESLRDAQWFLAHGTDEDKEQARADILRLQGEMKKVLEEFNAPTSSVWMKDCAGPSSIRANAECCIMVRTAPRLLGGIAIFTSYGGSSGRRGTPADGFATVLPQPAPDK